MSRLIDADALLRELKEHYNKVDGKKIYHPSMELAMLDVKAAPTIDAVPVVRCEECAHRRFSEFAGAGNIYCNLKHTYFPLDGFCKFGERREVAEL